MQKSSKRKISDSQEMENDKKPKQQTAEKSAKKKKDNEDEDKVSYRIALYGIV